TQVGIMVPAQQLAGCDRAAPKPTRGDGHVVPPIPGPACKHLDEAASLRLPSLDATVPQTPRWRLGYAADRMGAWLVLAADRAEDSKHLDRFLELHKNVAIHRPSARLRSRVTPPPPMADRRPGRD